jgi:hypothetical protein
LKFEGFAVLEKLQLVERFTCNDLILKLRNLDNYQVCRQVDEQALLENLDLMQKVVQR